MKHHILKDYEMAARFVAGMSTKPQPPQMETISYTLTLGKNGFISDLHKFILLCKISLLVQLNADIKNKPILREQIKMLATNETK